jgi:hypothetical protein
MDMWSASTTDISEGRSSGTVMPSRVSTLPSNSSGSSPNSSSISSSTSTCPVSMARLNELLASSSETVSPDVGGKETASASSSRHLRSSVWKPPGLSLTATRHPPPRGSGGSGTAASQKSPAGIRRAPGLTASSSGLSHRGCPRR